MFEGETQNQRNLAADATAQSDADVKAATLGQPAEAKAAQQHAPAVTASDPQMKAPAPTKGTVNWVQVLSVVLEVGEALAIDVPEIEMGQAVQAPVVYVTLGGHRYATNFSLQPAPN